MNKRTRLFSRPLPLCYAVLCLSMVVGLGCASGPSMTDGADLQDDPTFAAFSAFKSRLIDVQEPIVIRSQGGLLDVTMEAIYDQFNVPTGSGSTQAESLRVYKVVQANGVSYADSNAVGYPGPTFRVQSGDSVRLQVINKLPANPGSGCLNYPAVQNGVDTMPNCFHGPNSTNVHYHGFHITPSGTGDNVLLDIPPGDTLQSAFRIPFNQSPGTHWYHPHKHGSVALQVVNGMAGAFIVEGGGLDSLTQAQGMKERTLVIQQIDSDLNLTGNQQGRVTLINGQLNPTIRLRPGEVQRWRIVNAGLHQGQNYRIFFQNQLGPEPSLYAIARDGVSFAPANYTPNMPDTAIVSPGNRLDVFVKAPPQPGLHQLEQVVVSNLNTNILRQLLQAAQANPLLNVLVEEAGDERYATQLPPTIPPLPPFLDNLPDPGTTAHEVIFNEQGGPGNPGNPPKFYVGTPTNPQQQFNPSQPFITAPLDETQNWRVENYSTTGTANVNHPFHIHINPFQVVEVGVPQNTNDPNTALYTELQAAINAGYPIWMDTIALPLADPANPTGNPGYVVLRQKFEDFTGDFVLHCHILGHEERGMMQLIRVAEPTMGLGPVEQREETTRSASVRFVPE